MKLIHGASPRPQVVFLRLTDLPCQFIEASPEPTFPSKTTHIGRAFLLVVYLVAADEHYLVLVGSLFGFTGELWRLD